jgi:hypothetical protein
VQDTIGRNQEQRVIVLSDNAAFDWQLVVGPTRPELAPPPKVWANDHVSSLDESSLEEESGMEAGEDASSSTPAVRVLVLADARSPTT